MTTHEILFAGRGDPSRKPTTGQFARLVGEWIRSIGLDPPKFGPHSLRPTKAVLIDRRTGNLRAVQCANCQSPVGVAICLVPSEE